MSAEVRRPPGPKGLPLVGSLRELRRAPTDFLLDMSRNYGDVAYARFGPTPVYFISSPALVEELLVGRHKDWVKDVATRELIPLVGYGLLTSEGDYWKRQRRLAAPPLQPKRIANYADVMVECAQKAFSSFRDHEVRDIYLDMTRVTLEIVGRTLLGVDPTHDAERIARCLDVAMVYLDHQLRTLRGLIPQWIETPDRKRFKRAVKELDAIVYRIIERCRKEGTDADHLLARLVHLRDENGEGMSDAQLRDEAITMLLAGHETTALTLSYAVYLLSEHPDAARRVRDEVDSVLGDRAASVADLPKLRQLDAVVRETLRLYPPAYAMAREVARPFELGGYLLPKDAQIMMSPYAMHRDPRYFSRPDSFDPQRFLREDTAKLPKFAYFPFGGGPRVCIGNHFAMMEATLLLATLFQNVELRVVPGFSLELEPIVTLRPKHGIKVLVRRRTTRHGQHGRPPAAGRAALEPGRIPA